MRWRCRGEIIALLRCWSSDDSRIRAFHSVTSHPKSFSAMIPPMFVWTRTVFRVARSSRALVSASRRNELFSALDSGNVSALATVWKVREGGTASPTRETRVLPGFAIRAIRERHIFPDSVALRPGCNAARSSGERTRLACWRRRPAFADFPHASLRNASQPSRATAQNSSFRRDAETSTRDACAPRISATSHIAHRSDLPPNPLR